jgi:Lysyl oxidase/EGF-like domain
MNNHLKSLFYQINCTMKQILATILLLSILWNTRGCIVSPPCAGIPNCWEHGLCDNNTGTPVCVCDAGYTGPECLTSDCGCVHGTCVSASCVCDPGWSGAVCDEFQGLWPLYEPTCNMNNTCVCGGAGVSCAINPPVGVDLVIYTDARFDPYLTEEKPREKPTTSFLDFPDCDCRIGSPFIYSYIGRKVLTVRIDVMNIGTAHLFIGKPSVDYYEQDCMGRSLFTDWAKLELRNSSMVIVRTVYPKYRFWDSTGGLLEHTLFTDSMQGLSVKSICSSLVRGNECSWLDVTDLPATDTYTLTITVNPNQIVPELDYTNNALSMTLDCPLGCGVNGVCEWGSCVCSPGWKGYNCNTAIVNYIIDSDTGVMVIDENSTCLGDCSGKSCGDDGCGNNCGYCQYGSCSSTGACFSDPICRENECGPNNAYGIYCGFCDKPGTECRMDFSELVPYPKCLHT